MNNEIMLVLPLIIGIVFIIKYKRAGEYSIVKNPLVKLWPKIASNKLIIQMAQITFLITGILMILSVIINWREI